MGVAGVLISDERHLVLTSNRGGSTIGIISTDDETAIAAVEVGVHPNGLAHDPARNLLLAANIGDPAIPGSHTVSLVDVTRRVMVASVSVPGRTRWAVFDAQADCFYVNIMEPALIAVIDADNPTQVARTFAVPAAGPHGLELEQEKRRLFCACDGKKLVTLAADTGRVLDELDIGGVPDVIFFNPTLEHVYVAIGNPGVIEVVDTRTMRRVETVFTEGGAHTLAFDAVRNKVYAFLPQTHRAMAFVDEF